MSPSFRQFADDVLCHAAHLQRLHEVSEVDLIHALSSMKVDYDDEWSGIAIQYLVQQGFAVDGSTMIDRRLRVTGEGFAEVERIHERRKPPTISDRLASDKFQKVGGLAVSTLSLLISIGALLVAIFALSKT
ncbi:hypothetical protein [Porphyrobacter sp. GA68]|uniref:hypothetical protein n=1 Tax=Porphyrobacter sp. GA68 TaxID=2883480 RepID=UPI001D185D72|nr:hypothetical protein [Porphyrobacter sp. GA68]